MIPMSRARGTGSVGLWRFSNSRDKKLSSECQSFIVGIEGA
jgi:hypothetical protein